MEVTLSGMTYLNFAFLAAVIFVNGFTDAPNAIATTVSSKTMSHKNAVILSAVMNFFGVLLSSIFKPAVASNVLQMFSFDGQEDKAMLALGCAMFGVVVWSVAAWIFGIPTSESHALLAGLAGASFAVDRSNITHFLSVWTVILKGIVISSLLGFFFAFFTVMLLDRLSVKNKNKRIIALLQIIMTALLSFLHGSQDGQKLLGIGMIILRYSDSKFYFNSKKLISAAFFCSVLMGIGTLCSGKRIITTVSEELYSPDALQSLVTDFAAGFGVSMSTYRGLPVSTTTTKTMAIIGASLTDRKNHFDKRTAAEIVIVWLLTLPVCCIFGYILTTVMLIFL